MFSRIVAWFLSGINAFLLWAQLPLLPTNQKLDLDKFTLTWQDEFDGESLDNTKWGPHGFTAGAHKRRDGWWALDIAQIRCGALHIPSAYVEDGLAGGPAGYYSLGIDTRGLFAQKYGYFEARCKLPRGQGLWSAFWMMPAAFGTDPDDGRTGAEVDIYESAYHRDRWPKKNSVSSAIHYGGYGDNLHSQGVGRWFVSRPYDTFHTYGVEWNETEYIFYIDGKETARSSFGGVCQNELYLLLSVEHEFGTVWTGDIRLNKPEDMTDFVIDYVRVYQYKELL